MLLVFAFFLVGCKSEKTPPIEKEEVSIIFDTGTNDVLVDTLKGYQGDAVSEPNKPLRNGYKFMYWSLDNEPYTFSVFPENSILLKAVWEKYYTITFDVGEHHDGLEPQLYLSGEAIDLPILEDGVFDQKGYRFVKWVYEGSDLNFTTMPSNDLLLTAVFEESLMVSFNVGASKTKIGPLFLSEGDKLEAPSEIPKLENHVFSGWMLNGAPYLFKKMPSNSLTLEAKYIALDGTYNQETSLPKMFINLEHNLPLDNVTRETYVNSQISIHDEEHGLYSVTSEFKGRGHGSWTDSGPKKGYRLKFASKEIVFGQASNKHWVLLAGANFYDPTLAKNTLAFNLARDVFSHIEYSSYSTWVELYVNDEYRGVYLIVEHVRVDKNRVNIKSEFGPLDTGYFLEYDAYGTEEGAEGVAYFKVPGYKYPFVMASPDHEDYLDEGITLEQYKAQVSYIKDYVTPAFQAALNQDLQTFMEYVDIHSFIDMYLLHELTKNTDTGWSSFYIYKKPGGKLYAGPAWDFDASMGTNRGDVSPYGYFVSDSVQATSSHTASELYINLMKNAEFKAMVLARWTALSHSFKTYVNDFLSEAFIQTNALAFGINYARWSGKDPSYGHYPTINEAITKWSNDTNALRTWLIERANWFDLEADK